MSFTEIMATYWVEMLIISLIVILAMCTLYFLASIKFKIKDRPGKNKFLVVLAYILLFVVADMALIATLIHKVLFAFIVIAIFAFVFLVCGIYLLARKINANKKLDNNLGYKTKGKLVYSAVVDNLKEGKNKTKGTEYYCTYIEYLNESGKVIVAKSVTDLTLRQIIYLYNQEEIEILAHKKYCKVVTDVPSTFVASAEDEQKYSNTYKVKK